MTAIYIVVGAAVAIYAVRIVVAAVRNSPVTDVYEPTSCPPIDADTVLRKQLEDGWKSIRKQYDDRAGWPDAP